MRLVLLPGLDGTGNLFKPFIKALPSNIDITIIRYATLEEQTYDELLDIVIAQLPEEDYVLVGESFSGYIAYQIALKQPKFLKEVVFVASFLSNPRPLALSVTHYLPSKLLFSFSPPTLFIKTFMLGFGAKKSIIKLFVESLKEVSAKLISFRLEEVNKLQTTLEKSNLKAMYIQADNDYLVPFHAVDDFKRCFSQLRVARVRGPHFILQAKPIECAEVVAGVCKGY